MQAPANLKKVNVTIATRKDFEISYFKGPGPGGQKKNKTESGVHIKHIESGAIGRASESRSQGDNKEAALKKLIATPKFKFWFSKKMYEINQGQTVEQAVEQDMKPENLLIEVKDDEGKWIELKDEQSSE